MRAILFGKRRLHRSISRLVAAGLTIVFAAAAVGQGLTATEPTGAIRLGSTAVSGFSGAVLDAATLPPGVDPADRTIIDLAGPSVRIFDMSTLGGDPAGQTITPPVLLDIKARDIGQVFGLAFDNGAAAGAPQNLYAGATSAYGLRIVTADGENGVKPARTGGPGARFMDGQFGALAGAGPGTIYKIDGTTGLPALFATTGTGAAANSGPGLGDVAFDPSSKSIYASDLDTGLIHHFDSAGTLVDQFDHGVAGRPAAALAPVPDDNRGADITSPTFKIDDPATWGFTPAERRTDGLSVNNGRLFYAVAAGPEIWSVGLEPDGRFKADARREVEVKATVQSPVTSIVFDGNGRMIIAQRGAVRNPPDFGRFTDPESGAVLRYRPPGPGDPPSPFLWVSEPEEYAIGNSAANRTATGGVALQYGFAAGGALDLQSCRANLAVTGDTMSAAGQSPVHGFQINGVDLIKPQNQPPTRSVFADYDGRNDDPDALGHIGDVAVSQTCGGGPAGGDFPVVEGFPPIGQPPLLETLPVEPLPPVVEPPVVEPPAGGLTLTKTATAPTCSAAGGCSFSIVLANTGAVAIEGPFVIDDTLSAGIAALPAATLAGAPTPPWTCVSAAPKFTCTHPGPLAPGEAASLDLTFTPGPVGQEPTLQNCAVLQDLALPPPPPPPVLPPLAPPPPPSGTDKAGLKVEKRAVSPTCSATAGNCEFEIILTNTGNAPIVGPLKVTDTLSTGTQTQAKGEVQVQQLPAGFSCKPQGRETVCENNQLTIAPKQSTSFKLTFKVDATEGGAAGFVGNRVNVTLGALDGEASAAIPFDVPVADPAEAAAAANPVAIGPVPPACATIALDPDAPAPEPSKVGGLEISKVVSKDTPTCSIGTPCTFIVTVKNTNATPAPGPIIITDTFSGEGVKIPGDDGQISPPWSCDKGNPSQCTFPNEIPAGQSIDMTISVKPLAGTTGPALRNCVLLPGGAVPACATIPVTPPQPSKLTFVKNPVAAQCSDIGGGCDFMISITNPGPAEFNGPIEFTDVTTAADGKPLPALFMTTNGSVLADEGASAGFNCTKAGAGFVCKAPTAKIPAGKTVRVPMNFTPGPAGGATAIKNCATLAGGDGEPQCRNIPLVNGPLLRAQKFTAATTCVPNCAFAINIQNIGNSDAVGPFIFDDVMTPAGPNMTIEVIDGDFNCANVGAKLTCVSKANTALKPLELRTVRVIVSGAAPGTEFKNCAEITDLKGVPIQKDSPGRCVTITDKRPIEPKLSLRKELNGNPACRKTGNGLAWICEFRLVVTNNGNAPFNGKLVFTDEASVVMIASGRGGLTCDVGGGRQSRCEAQASIAQGQQAVFPVATTVLMTAFPPGVTPANGGCVVSNSATLTSPPGQGNQTAGPVTAVLPAVENKGKAVPCDPPNLKLSKAAKGCTPSGGGFECGFKLTVTSIGPDPFQNGEIAINETLPAGATVKTVSNGWVCSGAGAATRCVPPDTGNGPGRATLPVGSALSFDITVAVPANAAAPGQCEIENQAQLIEPGRDMSLAGANFRASAKARIDSPACTIPKTEPPPAPKCYGGMALDAAGQCACPLPSVWNGRACAVPRVVIPPPPPPPVVAPPVVVPQVLPCPAGMIGTRPNCSCPRGQRFDGRRCVTLECPRGSVGTYPNCRQPCPPGTNFVNGACRRPECPPGTTGVYPKCCPPGTFYQNGVCTRPQPTPPPPPPKCPQGTTGVYPKCCPPGTFYQNGVCTRPQPTPPPPPPKCPQGTTGVYPKCCPPGTFYQNGVCTRPQPTPPPKCPQGMTGVYPQCCPPGTLYQNGVCTRPQPPAQCRFGMVGTPPNCQCPAGTTFRRGRCVGAQPTPPPVRNCPPGYKVLTTPNKYGAYCEVIPVPGPVGPKPPVCVNGSGPSCICPPGTRRVQTNTAINCIKPAAPPPQQKICYNEQCIRFGAPIPGSIGGRPCLQKKRVPVACGSATQPK